jgi:hypothetical protein
LHCDILAIWEFYQKHIWKDLCIWEISVEITLHM